MDYDQFIGSLANQAPPIEANIAMRALWYDANDKPESALRTAMADNSHTSLRVRAYLCRKTGDDRAAKRCYWQCGVTVWQGSYASEWEDIVRNVLVELVVERAYQ